MGFNTDWRTAYVSIGIGADGFKVTSVRCRISIVPRRPRVSIRVTFRGDPFLATKSNFPIGTSSTTVLLRINAPETSLGFNMHQLWIGVGLINADSLNGDWNLAQIVKVFKQLPITSIVRAVRVHIIRPNHAVSTTLTSSNDWIWC